MDLFSFSGNKMESFANAFSRKSIKFDKKKKPKKKPKKKETEE